MLDTGVTYSTYSVILESQKGSIEALNFLIIGIDYTIGFIIYDYMSDMHALCNLLTKHFVGRL